MSSLLRNTEYTLTFNLKLDFTQNYKIFEVTNPRGAGGGDSHSWPDGDARRNF